MTKSRGRRILVGILTYAGIIAVTLVVVDLICIALGLFPPRLNSGDAKLGWRAAQPTGRMEIARCMEFSTGMHFNYARNEDGVRTDRPRSELIADTSHVKIAVTGDSHTDLCAPNPEVHFGVLESRLQAENVPAIVFSYGSGRYSPLQAYLAFREVMKAYHPQVLVLNLYTGNDFYDILRSDDRPHFVRSDSGYRIADPVWFSRDDPAARPRSRVLFAFRSLADKTGIRPLYKRLVSLRELGAEQGEGFFTILSYMRDLWRAREPSVGYSDAFTSQFLNQQLFFRHFPGSVDESVRRISALMTLIREENPGVIVVMSPIPSYQLTGEQPVDDALVRTIARLPVDYETGKRQEEALYDQLRTLSDQQGWIFVDNLAHLRGYTGGRRLFNDFDYHLLPVASEIIGRAQAAALHQPLTALVHPPTPK